MTARHAYVLTNGLTGLAASAMTPTNGPSDATRAYLNDGRIDKQYAWTSNTSQKMVFDRGAASADQLAYCAILNHNLPQGCTITVESASDAAFTTAHLTDTFTLAAPNVASYKDSVFYLANSLSAVRYWRITFTLSSAQVTRVGEIWLAYENGAALGPTSLTRKSIYGSGEKEDLITVQSQMLYGETRAVYYAGPVREKRLRFADLNSTALAEMRAFWAATKGPVTPFLWVDSLDSVTSDVTQECLYGRLLRESHEWTQDDYGVYQPGDFIIRSLGREVGA